MGKDKSVKLFGWIFWFHLLLEVIALSSPFLFSWQYILLGITVLSIQYWIVGGCILNKWQFGDARNRTFIYPYLEKMGFDIDSGRVKFFMRVTLPLIILIVALLWQIILNNKPLVF